MLSSESSSRRWGVEFGTGDGDTLPKSRCRANLRTLRKHCEWNRLIDETLRVISAKLMPANLPNLFGALKRGVASSHRNMFGVMATRCWLLDMQEAPRRCRGGWGGRGVPCCIMGGGRPDHGPVEDSDCLGSGTSTDGPASHRLRVRDSRPSRPAARPAAARACAAAARRHGGDAAPPSDFFGVFFFGGTISCVPQ
jgi:hypothetical protein